GILFLVRVGFVPAAVMLEGAGGTEAIRRSWRLAKGDGWRIFGILLSTIIISGVVGFLLSFPFGRLARAMGAGGWWLAAFGEALANVVTTPFGAIVFVLAYFDLRIRKEGLDP
ncbi:MAG: glycerophosphoryl diester phosphodiesterase membrane domain-containing protein, partial [Actinomycetota bacterium]